MLYVLPGVVAVALVVALLAWWLAAGRYTTIPPLRGVLASTARTELSNLGLHSRLGADEHNPLAKGDVILTKPAIGAKVANGSTVTIVVSLGPVIIDVPDVSGQPLAQAQAALRKAHLTPGLVTTMTSSSVPVGDVIFTTPRAYTSWPQDKPVGLTESVGPGLPNFVGSLVPAAQATATTGGYTINSIPNATGTQPVNTITSQSPAANTPITPGEVVTVHFSPGPPTVAVPNVQGMPVHQAINELKAAGFQWNVSQSGPGNRVCSYSPTTPQPTGTTITLNIGGFFCGF
jgi:beta-lactam-binding protein with PASTA domain